MKNLQLGTGSVSKYAGFTLVELIAVLLITGILAAVSLPRFFNKPTYDVRGYYDQALAILRYGQKLAIAQNVPVYVRLNGASIALCYDAACATPVTAPAGANSGSTLTKAACGNSTTWFCEAPATDVTYVSSNAVGKSYNTSGTASALFYFSPLGKPFNTGDNAWLSTFNSLLTVTMSGDGANHLFYVEQETGYVHR